MDIGQCLGSFGGCGVSFELPVCGWRRQVRGAAWMAGGDFYVCAGRGGTGGAYDFCEAPVVVTTRVVVCRGGRRRGSGGFAMPGAGRRDDARCRMSRVAPPRSPPGAHKGAPLRFAMPDGALRFLPDAGRRDDARCRMSRVAPPRSPPGAHKGAPLRGEAPAGKTYLRRACWRRCALWWATLPRPVPRQAPTRERPYGGGGRPQGSAPTGGGACGAGPGRLVTFRF